MICWFHRRVLSRSLDANAAPPAGTLRHLRHCAACSGFYETQARIVRELAAGADACRSPVSPRLERRIIAGLRQEESKVARAEARFPSFWPVAAATACVLLASFLWLQNRPVPDRPLTRSDPAEATPAELTALLELPGSDDLRDLSRRLNLPLETEMQLVMGDAKTAMNYLAFNFLPDQLRQTAFGENDP